MGCGPEQQQQVHGGNDAEESPAAMASTRGGRAGGTLTAHKSAHTAEAGLAAVAGASGNSTTARSKGHRGTQSYRDPLHAHKVFAFAQVGVRWHGQGRAVNGRSGQPIGQGIYWW